MADWGEERYNELMAAHQGVQRDVAELRRRAEGQAVSAPAGPGGGGSVTWVKVLPAIPTKPKTVKKVIWMSSSTDPDGTGNDGEWTAKTGDTAWKCIDKLTDLSGVPV